MVDIKNTPSLAITVTESGYSNDAMSLLWLQHFDRLTQDRQEGRCRLLIVDGYDSHHCRDLNSGEVQFLSAISKMPNQKRLSGNIREDEEFHCLRDQYSERSNAERECFAKQL